MVFNMYNGIVVDSVYLKIFSFGMVKYVSSVSSFSDCFYNIRFFFIKFVVMEILKNIFF